MNLSQVSKTLSARYEDQDLIIMLLALLASAKPMSESVLLAKLERLESPLINPRIRKESNGKVQSAVHDPNSTVQTS